MGWLCDDRPVFDFNISSGSSSKTFRNSSFCDALVLSMFGSSGCIEQVPMQPWRAWWSWFRSKLLEWASKGLLPRMPNPRCFSWCRFGHLITAGAAQFALARYWSGHSLPHFSLLGLMPKRISSPKIYWCQWRAPQTLWKMYGPLFFGSVGAFGGDKFDSEWSKKKSSSTLLESRNRRYVRDRSS